MAEMAAEIWADSEGEGKGATFVLSFPLTGTSKQNGNSCYKREE